MLDQLRTLFGPKSPIELNEEKQELLKVRSGLVQNQNAIINALTDGVPNPNTERINQELLNHNLPSDLSEVNSELQNIDLLIEESKAYQNQKRKSGSAFTEGVKDTMFNVAQFISPEVTKAGIQVPEKEVPNEQGFTESLKDAMFNAAHFISPGVRREGIQVSEKGEPNTVTPNLVPEVLKPAADAVGDVFGYVMQPVPKITELVAESVDEKGVPYTLGRVAGVAGDVIGYGAKSVYDAAGDAVDYVEEAGQNFNAGLQGRPLPVGDETIEDTPKIEEEVKVLTDIATNEKPPSLDPALDKEVQEAAKVVTDGVTDGQPPKTMLGLAGTMLGNIFSDPAVQQALVYYAGARLMGYSAGGSGMAAGQVLKSGWEQQAVLDKEKRALSAAQAKSKSPDLSETVEMWDPATRSIVSGNMAPNGDFYPSDRNLQAGPSRALGYVTYKPSLHKTTAELNHDLVTYGNDAVTNTLKTLDKKDYPYADQANNLFIDGGAVAEVVSLVSEKFRGTGVDYGTPSFRQSIERTIRSTVKSVAKKGPDSEGVLVADLASQVEANFLKVNMFNEDKVPKFVLSKVIWDGDKISGIDEDYEVAPRHVTKLFINANNLTNQILNQADAAYPNNREAHRSKVTNQKTIANLSKIFKDTVMNDKDRLKHWQQQGDKVQSNAFMAWVSSGGSNTEQKYLGLNNPSVVRKVAQMYDASFK